MTPFDRNRCSLGEGPLWHPLTGALYYFDILEKKLYKGGANAAGGKDKWSFDEHFSAAGWVEENTLLLASETGLWRFETLLGTPTKLIELEADNSLTRSNDGRADPWGGFWIGTMGKQAEQGAGAIYRYYKGELRKIVGNITISNAICFAPDKSCAYYTDTATQKIMRLPLNLVTGWSDGGASVFVDLAGTLLNPDGAVTDAQGNVWVAMWGAACVICFDKSGAEVQRIDISAQQPTCPAFGGPDLCDLYVTSATYGLNAETVEKQPLNGATLVISDVAQGLPEPQVIL